MPSFRRFAIVFLLGLTLVSCRRDPNVAKRKYLESGNAFLEHDRLKNAAIQYQNAVKIDPKYGPAYYKLGIVYMKLKPAQVGLAVREYRRAVELLKGNQAYQEEYKDSMIQLAQLDLAFMAKDKTALADVEGYCEELFKRDPNSFEGFRLTGDLDSVRAQQAADAGPTVVNGLVNAAMENYRKADAVKPGDEAVSMSIGQILQYQKQYAEAEPYYRKVIDKDKTSYPGYMALYKLYMIQQKTGQAEQLLKEGVQNNPKSHEYLERLAYHYGALGRRDDMLNVLQQIKAHAKDFDAVYQVTGDFYFRIGDMDGALREYREGVVQDPKRKGIYQHDIIQTLLRQGKRAEAAEVNNEVLKENPKDPDAKSLAATFLLDQGDINNALIQLQGVVTSSPDNAVAHYELGRAYVASGRPDAREMARQNFERAIQLRQDYLQPRLGLAELQVMYGEFEAALETVKEILQRDPANVNAKVLQSRALLGQKKYQDSDALLANVLKTNPGSPDVYFQSGMSARSQGKLPAAEAAFQRAWELNPNNSMSLLGVVDVEIQQGQGEKAMTVLQNESKKAPNRMDLVLIMGQTARRVGKYQDSLTYLNRVLDGMDKKSKARAEVYYEIAETYRMAGDRNNAIATLQKAREITPESEKVLVNMGVIMDQAGRRAEARQAYEACLKVDPNNAQALNNLAFLMAETNADLDLALNYAQKAKGLLADVADVSDTYGWILLKKGLPEQAIPVFQDLVNRVPANASYRFHLAKSYAQKGDNAKAAAELREALKHSPTREEQQEMQDMLSKIGGGKGL
jgi:tetratricopeptide (TPR) repeat protein